MQKIQDIIITTQTDQIDYKIPYLDYQDSEEEIRLKRQIRRNKVVESIINDIDNSKEILIAHCTFWHYPLPYPQGTFLRSSRSYQGQSHGHQAGTFQQAKKRKQKYPPTPPLPSPCWRPPHSSIKRVLAIRPPPH